MTLNQLMGPRIIGNSLMVEYYYKGMPGWVYLDWLPSWRWCRRLRAAFVRRKRFTLNHEFMCMRGWTKNYRNRRERPSNKVIRTGNAWIMHPALKNKIELLARPTWP